MKISYGILVCDENEEFQNLIDFLLKYKDDEDEIVVLQDTDNVTEEVMAICNNYSNYINVYSNPLNKNFAQQKNFLNSKCNGDYIFNIDSDEIFTEGVLEIIRQIIDSNQDTDLFYLPRVNIVNGITEDYIRKMRWNIDINGYINYPDYQSRIYRNCYYIEWKGNVHETISGFKNYSMIPVNCGYDILHIKDFVKQVKQNNLYQTI